MRDRPGSVLPLPVWLLLPVLLALLVPLAVAAQGQRSASGIYSCIDERGRRITSDRPIPECIGREQRVLNRDGSVRSVVPPTMTAEERARREAAERQKARERAARADAVRRDRNLMVRYPDEAAHDRVRASALATVAQAERATEQRLQALAAEKVTLDNEAEFYRGRPLPALLRRQLDANEAAVMAQQAAMRNQAAERQRIDALYDAELERLRRLWAGAEPGTLPALPDMAASAARDGRPPATKR